MHLLKAPSCYSTIFYIYSFSRCIYLKQLYSVLFLSTNICMSTIVSHYAMVPIMPSAPPPTAPEVSALWPVSDGLSGF